MLVMMYEEHGNVILKTESELCQIRDMTCKKLLNQMCALYGSTYEGRREVICRKLQIVKMSPILLSDKDSCIVFPVVNGTKGVWWFSYQAIHKIRKAGVYGSQIDFYGGLQEKVEVPYRSLERQMQRCRMYLKILHTYDLDRFLKDLLDAV